MTDTLRDKLIQKGWVTHFYAATLVRLIEVAELVEWLQEEADDYECIGCEDSAAKCKRAAELLQRQALVPVPVSERLPGPEVCVPHPRTKRGNWCWGFERCEVSLARPARWRLMHMETVEMEASHWLPAHALPLPEVNND